MLLTERLANEVAINPRSQPLPALLIAEEQARASARHFPVSNPHTRVTASRSGRDERPRRLRRRGHPPAAHQAGTPLHTDTRAALDAAGATGGMAPAAELTSRPGSRQVTAPGSGSLWLRFDMELDGGYPAQPSRRG